MCFAIIDPSLGRFDTTKDEGVYRELVAEELRELLELNELDPDVDSSVVESGLDLVSK